MGVIAYLLLLNEAGISSYNTMFEVQEQVNNVKGEILMVPDPCVDRVALDNEFG